MMLFDNNVLFMLLIINYFNNYHPYHCCYCYCLKCGNRPAENNTAECDRIHQANKIDHIQDQRLFLFDYDPPLLFKNYELEQYFPILTYALLHLMASIFCNEEKFLAVLTFPTCLLDVMKCGHC